MNQEYTPPIDKTRKHVGCVGDSITFGYGVWGTRKKDAFPAILESLFESEYQFVNYGLPGRCLMRDTADPFSGTNYFPDSLNLKAEIYLILLGTNDGVSFNWEVEGNENGDIFRKDLRDFVSAYKNLNNHPQIFLMTPPDVLGADDPDELIILDKNLKTFIRPAILELGKEFDIPVIDLYELTKDKKEYFDDGIHPNLLGNKIIAHYIFDEMKKNIYYK